MSAILVSQTNWKMHKKKLLALSLFLIENIIFRVTLFYKKSKAKKRNVISHSLDPKDSKKPKFDHLDGRLVVLPRV